MFILYRLLKKAPAEQRSCSVGTNIHIHLISKTFQLSVSILSFPYPLQLLYEKVFQMVDPSRFWYDQIKQIILYAYYRSVYDSNSVCPYPIVFRFPDDQCISNKYIDYYFFNSIDIKPQMVYNIIIEQHSSCGVDAVPSF